MNIRTMKGCLAAVLLGLSLLARAEDIDLFVGVDSDDIDLPNILFIIDNSANWNREENGENIFASVKGALSSTFANLQEDSVRVGIMMYNESGDGSGGYVRAAIRAMSDGNKQAYADLISTLSAGGKGDQGNKAMLSLAMPEAWYYFSGGKPRSGNVPKADYTGNTTGNPASTNVYALAGNALNRRDATLYNKPPSAGVCSKNYIVFLSNGPGNESGGDIKDSNNLLKAAGGDTTEIRLAQSGQQGNPADEWARFMKQSSLDITTYTIEVWPQTNGQGPNWTAVLDSMAGVSRGRYFPIYSSKGDATTASQIADALNTILSEIQAVNSVYASVSLPVSVNTQGTYLNQVFIGMFRPSTDASPRWHGNLKQYKLGRAQGSSSLQTLDANGVSAINASTGFITECARSYWTPATRDGYWSSYGEDRLHCLLSGLAASSNSPDGNQVEKGGHAYLLRAMKPADRKIYIASPSATGGVEELSRGGVSREEFGAADDAERDALTDWVRGVNNVGSDSLDSFVAQGAMRPSVHGDIVHSRPVAINYGSDVSPDVRVYYGGNDGLLRSINGNTDGGNEVWSFLPEEFYGKVKRLRDNSPDIYFSRIENSADARRKDYGFDGPVSAYRDGDKAWIFASMRRGGRSIYAFDVSAKNGPPSLLWRIGCFTESCTGDYAAIGQTWAAPAVVTASGHASDGKASPILLVGGGYDPCEDQQPAACSASSKGNRLYVINAEDGKMLRQFTTERGVIADVTPVKDENGHLVYGYTADLGGNVYRLSGPDGSAIGSHPPSDWELTQVASLGCGTSSTSCTNRKFMFAPDVVFQGNTYYLLLGSGDREKPIGNAGSTQNHFFMIKDQPLAGNATVDLSDLRLIDDDDTPSEADLAGYEGWYLQLNAKEQVVTSAITVFGTVTFSTHEPTPPQPGQCSPNLGVAQVYNIGYKNAAPTGDRLLRSEEIPGGGLPPSPVAGMVRLDDGSIVPFIIGGDPSSPLAGREPSSVALGSSPRARVYWNIEE